MDAWHFTTHTTYQLIGFLLRHMTLHTVKHVVADMLQGDIQIVADILLLSHHAQQVPWEVCGIGIVQTNPLHALYVSHLLNEFSNMLLAIDIYAIVRQFLGNHLKLLGSLTHQIAHLVKYLVHRTTLVLTGNNRYSAVGTMTVTSLGNLQVSIVFGGSDVSVVISNL